MKQFIRIIKGLILVLVVILLTVLILKYPKIKDKVELEISMHKIPMQIKYDIRNIPIKGVTGTYQFLYISDTHVVVKSREDLGAYGTYKSREEIFHNDQNVDSKTQFPNWIRLANQKKVDALLMGGDIVDYESKENYDYIDSYLAGLDMPYVYTLGNHDATIPWENTCDYKNKQFLKHFQNENYECQYLEYPSFIICSVNDNLGSISATALKEFKDVLKKNKPVIVMLHVPINTANTPALEERTIKDWKNPILLGQDSAYGEDETTKEFIDTVLDPNSKVQEVLAGHLHFYHVDKLNNSIEQIVSDGSYKGNGLLLKIQGK